MKRKLITPKLEEALRISQHMGNSTPFEVTDELGDLRELKRMVDKKEKFLANWLKNEAKQDQLSVYAVSYTHLTLPTKRIV